MHHGFKRAEYDGYLFMASLVGTGFMHPETLTPSMNPWREPIVLPPEQVAAKQANEQRRGMTALGRYLGMLRRGR